MGRVWVTFLGLAVLQVVGAWLALRYQGARRAGYRVIGRYFMLLAFVTAVYPAFLFLFGIVVWMAGYVAVVLVLLAAMIARLWTIGELFGEPGHDAQGGPCIRRDRPRETT